MEKRRLIHDKEANYYCEGIGKNSFLYKCNLDKAEELHMKYCNCCHDFNYYVCLCKLNYTLHDFLQCDICEKNKFHYHNLYKKYYESRYSKTFRFYKETIFVK